MTWRDTMNGSPPRGFYAVGFTVISVVWALFIVAGGDLWGGAGVGFVAFGLLVAVLMIVYVVVAGLMGLNLGKAEDDSQRRQGKP